MNVIATTKRTWTPSWATHPGQHLSEHLDVRGLSQADFARLADMTPKHVSEIINGKNPVTSETALKLERVLGLRAHVWANLQTNWNLHRARLADHGNAEAHAAWLENFPIAELVARGVVRNTSVTSEVLEDVLRLLGIGSVNAFEQRAASVAALFRKSSARSASLEHTVAWLALSELRAKDRELARFDRAAFSKAISHELRALTLFSSERLLPRLISDCAAHGVALVAERGLPKTRHYGATAWFRNDQPMIVLSLRQKTNDQLWWTFFHEAAHVILHAGRTFVDDKDAASEDAEREADDQALEWLVGRDRFLAFKRTAPRSEAAVREFAHASGIHPGIVVGLLQHEGALPFSHLNGLKDRIE